MTNPCFILGNGPSLRGFDFEGLGDRASLGMNAAYRYWDEIDWYPTYYACLDDQLIISHHDAIHRLWKEGRIRAFFVHGAFFDHHPDCIGAPEFTSLDQVLPYWYRMRAQGQGWPALMDHPAFWTSDVSKVTTGAWATRFAAFLGHDLIALAGIDLNYVEILPEARAGEGHKLEMAETPKENPNYFFDGYQRKGDKFNVPNPAVHDGRLHIDSFRLVAEDFARTLPGVAIVNTNPQSQLEVDRVFPLRQVEAVLHPPKLSCVVIPATRFEIADIIANFDIWADPDHAPLAPGEAQGLNVLRIVFNNRAAAPLEPYIRRAFADTDMTRFFTQLRIDYLDLTGKADRYERDYAKTVGDEGYKSGPNNQFFAMMALLDGQGADYVFQMETDCVPLRAGWLGALQGKVEAEAPFWILGARYTGAETLDPRFADHLNGNAVYAAGDPAFQRFVRDVWAVQTRALVAGADKRLAYDCILAMLLGGTVAVDDATRAALDSAAPHLRETDAIANISGKADLADLPDDFRADMAARVPGAVILHNRAAQKRTAALLARPVSLPSALEMDALALPPKPPMQRMLVIDMTAMGSGSATGEIKANLMRDWPAEALLQIAAPTPQTLALVRRDGQGGFVSETAEVEAIRAAVADFAPQVILYRILPDRPALHALAQEIIADFTGTLVTWVMDDWPARLFATDRARFDVLDPEFQRLLKRSDLRLAISDAMARAYKDRYGLDFVPLANGIDPADWQSPHVHAAGPVVMRYAGGLAPDMNGAALARTARVVEAMAREGRDIRFEINTQSWWKGEAESLFEGLKATHVTYQKRPFADYAAWLMGADIALIAYNFDHASLRYVRYSMANKMPECLASGAAVLAHGPLDVATVAYLADQDAARIVEVPDFRILKEALVTLMQPQVRTELAVAGRQLALERHDLPRLARQLATLVDEAGRPAARMAPRLYIGPAEGPVAPAPAPWTETLEDGCRALVVIDDPAAALACRIAAGEDTDRAVAAWIKATAPAERFLARHDDRATLLIRPANAEIAAGWRTELPKDLLDADRDARLSRPLRPVDPVHQALGALALAQDAAARDLAARLGARGIALGERGDNAARAARHYARVLRGQDAAASKGIRASLDRAHLAIKRQRQEIEEWHNSRLGRLRNTARRTRSRLGRIKRRLLK